MPGGTPDGFAGRPGQSLEAPPMGHGLFLRQADQMRGMSRPQFDQRAVVGIHEPSEHPVPDQIPGRAAFHAGHEIHDIRPIVAVDQKITAAAQIAVGLWQARAGLPIVLVNIHMVLAVVLVAAMTAVVLHQSLPATHPRSDPAARS